MKQPQFKIFQLQEDDMEPYLHTLVETGINHDMPVDSIDIATKIIENEGQKGIPYAIIPIVYGK